MDIFVAAGRIPKKLGANPRIWLSHPSRAMNIMAKMKGDRNYVQYKNN